jgi:hypothetical protein
MEQYEMTDSFGGPMGFAGLTASSLIFGQGWILAGAIALAVIVAFAIRIGWRRGKGVGES